jgi:hypothetical protein
MNCGRVRSTWVKAAIVRLVAIETCSHAGCR